ncbi:MAG: endo-1,4-beta-xylanase [Nonomuraea sp.]|nr:endo-1,4-beta-xylanase [Nonomuraea sp.]
MRLRVTALLVAILGTALAVPAQAAEPTLRTLASARNIKIGTAVSEGPLKAEGAYRDKARYEFGSLTPENAMKWARVEPERGRFDWSAPDAIVDFAQANNMVVRGHTLVWHGSVPSWITGGSFTDDELRALLKAHVETVMHRYAGKVGVWDVVNEAVAEDGTLRDSFWLRRLGPGYVADAFRWARAADPAAKLYINDFNAEWSNPKSDGLYALVKSLKAEGVPIDGVGFQTHVTTNSGLTQLGATLARFAALGVDVAVTELDVRMPLPADAAKLATQATLYQRATAACLAVARCVSLTVWGFTDAHSWVPGTLDGWGAATLLDEDYQAKPAYTAVHAALAARDFTTTVAGSGGCLAVPAVRAACDGSSGQRFTFRRTGAKLYSIVSARTGTCLSAASATVTQATCAAVPAQTFELRAVSSQDFQLRPTSTYKCLDGTAATVTVTACVSGLRGQVWRLASVPGHL